ncbi:MAG TPA: hypothetical protein VL484_09540 [Vicinamibacterales bacterium]|nr:hypothetical protein [Vicinamibacterales bacterium]
MRVWALTLRVRRRSFERCSIEVFVLFRSRIRLTALASFVVFMASVSTASAQQTVVFFRHAEKPASGLGLLSCQGLNRALALPAVLLSRFGTPDFLYAPDPSVKISDPTGSYYYVRPLTTIEPTAIRAQRSINTHYGYTDISSLESLIIRSTKANTTIFVSWEHEYLQRLVQDIMNRYGGGALVPAWVTGDYDTMYVVHVNYAGGTISATFERQSEGLNGQSTGCPQ